MRVIGTAGHVDHGKSTLVKALTGIDPDRLKEEKEREMTIDLGFAWLTLPDGEVVSIVDVPGHEDFIRNMLAGVGGIDLALLVIAADESIMPQTREHLNILDLLQVPRGIVALTKIDLVSEPEWLELVEMEVAEVLQGTRLEGAPLVPLSARHGQGLDRLLATLALALQETSPRTDLGRPRLSVDRVFSIAGFGTVVTGTLLDGTLRVGDEVVLLPRGRTGRVRGLQTHHEKVEEAGPGRRLAVNLSGLETDDIRRGDLLAHPGDYHATRLVDVMLRLLPDVERPIRHNQEIDFFSGAAQQIGHVRLIGRSELLPGEEGFAQIHLVEPLALARGDRYILRQSSPSKTLGGGRVLDALPRSRWRRSRPESVARFRLLAEGSPSDLLVQKLVALEPTDERTLLAALPLPADVARTALAETLEAHQVRRLEEGTLLSAEGWTRREEQLHRALAQYHKSFPLRLGLPREEVASRLALKPKAAAAFLQALTEAGRVRAGAEWVALADFAITLNLTQQQQLAQLLDKFAAAPFTPPNPGETMELIGEELMNYLIARGELVRISHEVLLGRAAYEAMVQGVRALGAEQGDITAADLRDRFQTSRKYAIALLEHLDTLKVTRRVGDKRILR
ncbi:MAG: selenocysteine-specific translation elongation factor [Ardenticatenales bacterium]|nr:selenocysteine-specific translation elongation factor [Ardenticatenales bacterium]